MFLPGWRLCFIWNQYVTSWTYRISFLAKLEIIIEMESIFLLVLRLLCRFRVCISVDLCVHTYHVRNNYVTYIVAMRPYLSRLRQFRRLLCVAAMSSLPQLRLQGGYREAEAT